MFRRERCAKGVQALWSHTCHVQASRGKARQPTPAPLGIRCCFSAVRCESYTERRLYWPPKSPPPHLWSEPASTSSQIVLQAALRTLCAAQLACHAKRAAHGLIIRHHPPRRLLLSPSSRLSITKTSTITSSKNGVTASPFTIATQSPPQLPTHPPCSTLLTEEFSYNFPSTYSPVTTASQPEQKWLPSPPDPVRQTATPQSQQQQDHDFVLYPNQTRRSFEAPRNNRDTPSLSASPALSGQSRRHSSHLSSATTLQNQRVAAIIQGTGHSISPPAFTNRYNPAQAQQFYASSAPSSVVALQNQQPRTRPAVPLFTQSTGNIHQGQSQQAATMAQDMDLFDDYSGGFDLEYDSSATFQGQYSSSPAIPTVYGQSMARTDSSQSNVGTVSPQDLMVRDPMSAPNSTAFTNLTSPSIYNQSPDFGDGYEVSPMFTHEGIDGSMGGDPWFPLFPDATNVVSAVEQPNVDESPLQVSEELEVADQLRGHNRRRSGTSPGSNKASTSSGVAARKRNQPLPPIIVDDPCDTVAIKRARNTLAARKSREKKMQRFDELEGEIEKLREERDHWKKLALARSSAQQ